MTRGTDQTFSVTSNNANGTPRNWAGTKAWFSARQAWGTPVYVFQKDSDGNGIVTDGTPGLATISIVPADTASVLNTGQTLVWDIRLKDADGKISTLAGGLLVVKPSVTAETA